MEVLLEDVHFLHEILQSLLALLLGQQPVRILRDRGAELRSRRRWNIQLQTGGG
jgi:hypothetical protein